MIRLNRTYKLENIGDSYAVPATYLPVWLFAAHSPRSAERLEDWRTRVGTRLEVVPVEGDHGSIMEDPEHRAKLAGALDRILMGPSPPPNDEASRSTRHPSLMLVQQGPVGAGALCCIPGAGATVASFLPLAERLGDRLSLYGLQPRGMDGKLPPHRSVSAAARSYIEELDEGGHAGPYRLVGHSFGGWVALEMAYRLRARGESVEPVVLLDVEPPSGNEEHADGPSFTDGLQRLIGLLEMTSGRPIGLSETALAGLHREAQLSCLLDYMKLGGLISRTACAEDIEGMLNVFMANLNTWYAPLKIYSGPVVLVSARERRGDASGSIEACAARWRQFAPDLTALDVDGNHTTILTDPHVEQVANLIGSRFLT